MKKKKSYIQLGALIALALISGNPTSAMDGWGNIPQQADSIGKSCNSCYDAIHAYQSYRQCRDCNADIHEECHTDGRCATCVSSESHQENRVLGNCRTCDCTIRACDGNDRCRSCNKVFHTNCMTENKLCAFCVSQAEAIRNNPWPQQNIRIINHPVPVSQAANQPALDICPDCRQRIGHLGATCTQCRRTGHDSCFHYLGLSRLCNQCYEGRNQGRNHPTPINHDTDEEKNAHESHLKFCQEGFALCAPMALRLNLGPLVNGIKLPPANYPPCPWLPRQQNNDAAPQEADPVQDATPEPPTEVKKLQELLANENKHRCCVCFENKADLVKNNIKVGWMICNGRCHSDPLCQNCNDYIGPCPLCRATRHKANAQDEKEGFVWHAEHPASSAMRAHEDELETHKQRVKEAEAKISQEDIDYIAQNKCVSCDSELIRAKGNIACCMACHRKAHRNCLTHMTHRGKICRRCQGQQPIAEPEEMAEVRIPLEFKHILRTLNGASIGCITMPNGRNGGDSFFDGDIPSKYTVHHVMVALNTNNEPPYYVLNSGQCNYHYVSTSNPTRPLPAGLYQWSRDQQLDSWQRNDGAQHFPGGRTFKIARVQEQIGYFDQIGNQWRASEYREGRHPFDEKRKPNGHYHNHQADHPVQMAAQGNNHPFGGYAHPHPHMPQGLMGMECSEPRICHYCNAPVNPEEEGEICARCQREINSPYPQPERPMPLAQNQQCPICRGLLSNPDNTLKCSKCNRLVHAGCGLPVIGYPSGYFACDNCRKK